MKLLTKTWAKDRFAFGGARLLGSHPKKKRSFHSKLALHVVMRSTQARGERSLFRHNQAIARMLQAQAERQSVKIYAVANAGNHLHLLVQAPAREQLSGFLRAISGRIAQLVAIGWDARPFSRIVSWGRDFKNVARYIGMNANEMLGTPRANVRQMYEKIREALREGRLAKTPSLVAAGFA